MDETNNYYFIVNPAAGYGRGGQMWQTIFRGLSKEKASFDWHMTSGSGDASKLAQKAPKQCTIVAIGGDGTLTEVIQGNEKDQPIGVIPSGLRNDFARSVGISGHPLLALRQITTGKKHRIDVPHLNGRPFLTTAWIVGSREDRLFHVLSKSHRQRRSGVLPSLALLRTILQTPPLHFSVELDRYSTEGEALTFAVGNCRHYGGDTVLFPSAAVDDGLLDIVIAGKRRWLQRIATLSAFPWERQLLTKSVFRTKAHRVVVDGPKSAIAVIDGRPAGRLPAVFTIDHRAYSLMLPPESCIPNKVVSIRRPRDDGRMSTEQR